MGSCAVDRVSVLQGLQVNWEREPSVCQGGWGVAGCQGVAGCHSLGSLLSLQFSSLPPGAENCNCNLQGLVTDGVSFKLVNGGLQKTKCGYCRLQEKSPGFLSNCGLAKFK